MLFHAATKSINISLVASPLGRGGSLLGMTE
jgi:hypothetical protein